MKQIDIRLKFKGDVSTTVWCADWHLGNQCVSMDSLDCLDDTIRGRNLQWIHGADAIEGIMPGDKRYDADEAESTVVEQIEAAVSRIKRMNKTCLGMLKGNHESSASKIVGDISKLICSQAGIPFLSQTCAAHIFAPHGRSTMFASHYINSITNRNEDAIVRDAGKQSRLRKLFRCFDFDLRLAAHIHKFICSVPVSEDRLALADTGLKHRPFAVHKSWSVVCPAFLKVYDEANYAQARMMEPTDIGWAEIDFNKKAEVVEVRNVLGDGKTKRVYRPLLVD